MSLPKFQPEIDPNPHSNHPEGFTCVQCPHRFYAVCVACGEDALRDEATKLCRPCWRVWRFSGTCLDDEQHCYNCRCEECFLQSVIAKDVADEMAENEAVKP